MRMTGGFDPGHYTGAPLQTEGIIRFGGSPDAVFARIANHPAMTDWVPLLKTVQVSHPKPVPPGESMVGTTRRTGAPRRCDHRGGDRVLGPAALLRLYDGGEALADAELRGVHGRADRGRWWWRLPLQGVLLRRRGTTTGPGLTRHRDPGPPGAAQPEQTDRRDLRGVPPRPGQH